MSGHRITLLTGLVAGVLATCANDAGAHTRSSLALMDQDVVITISEEAVEIEYSTSNNRPYAYSEAVKMDTDRDGQPSMQERVRYFNQLRDTLVAGLEIRINGREVPLKQIGEVRLKMDLGPDKALRTNDDRFRRFYRFRVPGPPDWRQGADVEFHNDNYLDVSGSITITVEAGGEAQVVSSSLRTKGDDPQVAPVPERTWSPPQQRDVVFRYRYRAAAGGAVRLRSRARTAPVARALAVMGAGAFLCVGMILVGRAIGVTKASLAATSVVMLCVCAVMGAWPVLRSGRGHEQAAAIPADAEAAQVFRDLHRGIYRAFEAKTHGEAYDVLAGSLDGRVLEEVYNEVHKALLLRGEGGGSFQIRRVKPLSTEILPASGLAGSAFRVRYRWRVYGTVTHYRHTHARLNEYEAVYTVRHNGRSWRIARVEARQHKRVPIGRS